MRFDPNTQAGLDFYNGPTKTKILTDTGQEIKLNHWYSYDYVGFLSRYSNYYINNLGVQLSDSIAILAYDDYGTTTFNLKVLGYNSRALNPSTYIQNNKNTKEDLDIESELTSLGLVNTDRVWQDVITKYGTIGTARAKVIILDEDGLTNPSRNNVRSSLGVSNPNNITWFICETHLEVFEDLEVQSMSEEWHKFADNVAWIYTEMNRQWVLDSPNYPWNYHTTSEWRALLPNDYLIRSSDGLVSVP